jgi:hypothetical protein
VYTLTGDLTCPEGVPGLTLLNHVTLDLGGYTLSVAGGVLLYVDEITVRNGTIVDCSVAGWCLYNDVYGIVRGDEGHNNLLHDLILERGVKLIGMGIGRRGCTSDLQVFSWIGGTTGASIASTCARHRRPLFLAIHQPSGRAVSAIPA